MNELDLDKIEALCEEYLNVGSDGNFRKWSIILDLAGKVPPLLARVRELEAECDRMGVLCGLQSRRIDDLEALLRRVRWDMGGSQDEELCMDIREALNNG